MIRTILLALAVNTARAGFGEHAAAPAPPAKPVPSRQIRTLVEREDKLMKLLKRQRETLIVKKTSDTVPALTRLDGILINSILAANDRPPPSSSASIPAIIRWKAPNSNARQWRRRGASSPAAICW